MFGKYTGDPKSIFHTAPRILRQALSWRLQRSFPTENSPAIDDENIESPNCDDTKPAGTDVVGYFRASRSTRVNFRRYLSKVSLLTVDDFGLKPLRTSEDEDFHDLIAERYERTATILTSNLDFDEWGAAFPANKMIGAATLDRLRHGAYKIVLDGDSYCSLDPASEKSGPPAARTRKTAAS